MAKRSASTLHLKPDLCRHGSSPALRRWRRGRRRLGLGLGVRILTRGGHYWTDRFPTIAAAVGTMWPKTMIVDGEAVVFDDLGGVPTSGCCSRRSAAAAASARQGRPPLLHSTCSISKVTT